MVTFAPPKKNEAYELSIAYAVRHYLGMEISYSARNEIDEIF